MRDLHSSLAGKLGDTCSVALLGLLVAVGLSACTSPSKSCTEDSNCFKGEYCNSKGTCVPGPRPDSGGADGATSTEDTGDEKHDTSPADTCCEDAPVLPPRCRQDPMAAGCPCDYNGNSRGVCGDQRRTETGACPKPAAYEREESNCDGKDNNCDGVVDGWEAGCGRKVMVGSQNDDEITAAAIDSTHALVVAGRTEGKLPGIDETKAGTDAFVAKYDSHGRRQWIQPIATDGDEAVTSVTTGGSRDIYVAGRSNGEIGGGGAIMGNSSGFVAKLSSGGQQEWIKRIDSEGDKDELDRDVINDVVVSEDENLVFAAGAIGGEIDGETTQGDTDGYVAALRVSDGTETWSKLIRRTRTGILNGAALRDDGTLLVAGLESERADGTIAGSQWDVYLAKFTAADGTLEAERQFGSPDDSERAQDVVAGADYGTPGTETHPPVVGGSITKLETSQRPNAFLERRSEDLVNSSWEKVVSADKTVNVQALGIDEGQTLHLVGWTNDDIKPSDQVEPIGGEDAFLIKRQDSDNANFTGVRYFGSQADDAALDIAIGSDAQGDEAFIVGWTKGAVGEGTNAGKKDGFIVKLP